MIKLKGYKGITLIALVITIIVLLILAGITIAQITGQDSAPNKAAEARQKNEQGAEFDEIKVAVVGAIANGNTGLVDAESLKNELNGLVENEGKLAIRSDNAPWIVVGKTGVKYKITKNGEVTLAEPVATVEFNSTTDSIAVRQSKKLSITCKGVSGYHTVANEVIFSSSNNNIATVQDDGSIKIADNATVGATLTITVVADGISGNNECVITVKENIWEIGTAINATNYGKRITNYKSNAETNQDDIGWKLFYQDVNYTYIIADKPQGNYKPSEYYNSCTLGNVGKGLNSTYYSSYPTQFNSLNNNMKAVTWMTDTSKWTMYTDSNNGNHATWAIASPSIELIIASFNADAENDGQTVLTTPTVEQYGYINSWYTNSPFPVDYNNGIYNYSSDPTDTNAIWWISSPANHHMYQYGALSCLIMNGSSNSQGHAFTYLNPMAIASDPIDTYSYPIRPVVCIPTSKFMGNNAIFTLE